MCGLAGVVLRTGVPDAGLIDRLAAALAHRGPDGEGRHHRGSTALVQRRLAVIDLETGNQPLFGADGAVLAANGEIYNYLELRDRLTGVGWRTKSDCEPPLELYRRHGLDFADHLRGMYAIAIDDPVQNRLVLARDPFGIKPLYLAETDAGVAFASEVQALIRAGWVQPNLDRAAIQSLFQRQFVSGGAPPISGVRRLLPGETVVIEQGRVVASHRRAVLPATGPTPGLDEASALTLVEGALRDSVAVHCRSDVPYGLFLSGGIDSSLILSLMAEVTGEAVRTVSAGFDVPGAADERAIARQSAARHGARHTEVLVTAEDFWRELPAIAAAMDDPAADYACLPTWCLARLARQDLTVVLSGEGGDELFAGYGRYRRAMRPAWLRWPRRNRGILAAVGLARSHPPAPVATPPASPQWTRLQAAQAADIAEWLPNDLLIKLDRCLMAHALEGRTPFLDPAVVAAAWQVPDHLKVSGRLGKYVLRRLLHRRHPDHPAFARKQGFTVPVGTWIAARGTRLAALVAASPGVAEVARTDRLAPVFAAADRDGKAAMAAWTLTFYALWVRFHVLGQTVGPDIDSMLSEQ
ncbi:MAG: asparagine synthase (glutamine-hydrolyzing) [Alphaproteobacteria bacterium]|nr:MAG: asparagine synthase (glutamine-hydrolyzing) [Alphaproteobacteria bacterium]